MPLIRVWAQDIPRQQFKAALADDPSVDEYILLASYEDEWLYRVEWMERIQLLIAMLTNAETVIRNHYETVHGWFLHILFPTRDELTHTHAFCSDHDLSFEIYSVRAFDGDQFDSRYMLTNEQYETLMHAFERGYFAMYRNIITERLTKGSIFPTRYFPSASARTMLSSTIPSVVN